MPALEPLRGLRVVADPAALDDATWTGAEVLLLRFAPDEAFAIGATAVDVADAHALIEPETGFVGARCAFDEIRRHLEWAAPVARPILAQGSIAGVPAKLWLASDDGEALLVTAAVYADTLSRRLGWPS